MMHWQKNCWHLVSFMCGVLQVQKIMEWFAEARKENIHKSVPYQIITIGTQWTPVVNNFTKAYMPDPSIVITSRFEAAIYGKVIQVQLRNEFQGGVNCEASRQHTNVFHEMNSMLVWSFAVHPPPPYIFKTEIYFYLLAFHLDFWWNSQSLK